MRIDSLAIPVSHPSSPRGDRAATDSPSRRNDAVDPASHAQGQRRAAPDLGRLLQSWPQDRNDLQSVAPQNRAAVSAYIANQPSAIERLGVELVGVDEFA